MNKQLIAFLICAGLAGTVLGERPIVHPDTTLHFHLSDEEEELNVVQLQHEVGNEAPAALPVEIPVAVEQPVVSRAEHVVMYHLESSQDGVFAECIDCGVKGPEKANIIPRPGDRDRSECPPHRYRMDPNKRAGNPYAIAPWAACSTNARYEACWVGGGKEIGGRHRTSAEGTWGLDFAGWLPRKIWLKWGARHDGGEGAYATDHEGLLE